jgi:putative peptidoglycan lipid II flippase
VAAAEEQLDLTQDSREVTVRNAAVMSVGTLLSRVTGLVRLSVTAAALGATTLSDAYNTANTTPNIVYELVLGGILTSVFVPVLVQWAKDHDRTSQDEVGSRFLTLALVTLSAIAVIAAFAAPWIMRLYVSGEADPVKRAQVVAIGTFFLRWFMPQIVFYGVGAVAAGILTAHRRFAAQMFAPVLNNVAVIVTMLAFLWMRHGVPPTVADVTYAQRTLLAAGTTFGVVAMTVALWPALRGIGFRWRLRFDWGHPTVRHLIALARWVVVYVVANQLALLVIINLNYSLRIDGAITVYTYAFLFFTLPHAIVAVSIFTALLPGMSERWSAGNVEGVRVFFSQGMRDTQIVMLPAAAGMIALAGPIVALLVEYGNFGSVGGDRLAAALAAFAVGLPFFSAFQLLTRTFYATHDSKTPAVVNIGVNVVNLGAAVVFAFGFGWDVTGLALGQSVSYLVGSVALVWLLRRRLGSVRGGEIGSTVWRTGVAAVLTGVAAFAVSSGVSRILDVTRPSARLAQVAASVAAGVLVFLLVALILRIDEVDEVRKALLGRFRR